MRVSRLCSVLAVVLATVLVVVPVDPASAWAQSVLVPDRLDEPLPGHDRQEPDREVPSELSADQVDRLVPDSSAARQERVSMPEGDYSSLLTEAEAVVPGAALALADPSAEGKDLAAEAETLKVSERSEYGNVYARGDGSFISELSPFPINVQVDGRWRETSTTLTARDGGFAVDAHPLSPEFAAKPGAPVTVSRDGHEVSFALVDGAAARGDVVSSDEAENDSLLLREVLPGTDVRYTVRAGGIKEHLVLHEAPMTTRWSWRLDVGALVPRVDEHGMVELVDPKAKPDPAEAGLGGSDAETGRVVMHIPPPVVWDSSGVAEESSDALTNGKVSLERTDGSEWTYSIEVDSAWVAAEERVFPVFVDPTMQVGPSYVRSYKSDGAVYYDEAHIGNTRQSNQNVYWRTFVRYPYGALAGMFLGDTQLGFGYADYSTGTFTGNAYHANAECYSCAGGGWVANYTLGTGTAWTAGDGVARKLASAFAVGDYGVSFLVTGDEGSAYSHKRLGTAVFSEYWGYPSVAHAAPAGGVTGSTLTPTLQASGSTGSPYNPGLAYRFTVALDVNFVGGVWNSGWTSASQVRIPEGVLDSDVTYYWGVEVKDGHDGYAGQSTVRAASTVARSLKTQKVPLTPPVGSASPGTATGVPETVTTLTPTLQVDAVADEDAIPSGGSVTYEFKIATGADGKTDAVYTSGLITAGGDGKVRFTVPEGVLQDGGVYSWVVQPHDGLSKNAKPTWVKKIKVDLRLGASGPSPFDAVGPVAVNLANGNANVSFASPVVQTLGGPMGMSFTYNSQSTTAAANMGLTATYYDARDANGNPPNTGAEFVFEGKQPMMVRTDSTPTFAWSTGSPGGGVPENYFLVRWSGMIRFPHDSPRWRIGIKVDDGARVRVAGNEVVSEWSPGDHPLKWSGDVSLGVTPTALQVDYFEHTGQGGLEVWVDDLNDSTPAVPLPASWLTRQPEVLPAGWSSSTPIAGVATTWVKAQNTGSAIVLTDATGTAHTHVKNSDGGYTPPQGEYGTVSLDATGRVVYSGEDGTVYQFDSRGYVESATPVSDGLKPATPVVIRDVNGVATAVVDPVSKDGATYHRRIEFTYQPASGSPCVVLPGGVPAPAGMLCKISYPNGTVTNLYYDDAGMLVMIEDPGNERTTFGYTSGVLTKVQDPGVNDYLATVTGTPPFDPPALDVAFASGRAASVTLPSSDGIATRLRKNYTYDTSTRATSVALHGVANSTSTVTYDAAWRKLTATSPMGVESATEWHPTKDLSSRRRPRPG